MELPDVAVRYSIVSSSSPSSWTMFPPPRTDHIDLAIGRSLFAPSLCKFSLAFVTSLINEHLPPAVMTLANTGPEKRALIIFLVSCFLNHLIYLCINCPLLLYAFKLIGTLPPPPQAPQIKINLHQFTAVKLIFNL